MATHELRNMKASPPIYLTTSSVGLLMGLDTSMSMVPLLSMLGMKNAVMITPKIKETKPPRLLTR